jgi:Cu+-exporting ATPase
MTVTPASEHHYAYQETDYYFCCQGCQTKFAADPEHYLNPPEPAAGTADLVHICPMCPEVRQQGPGACPSCGMALEPETLQPLPTRTEYTCPMHPEIVQDTPGNCPKCGMALEPRTITVEEKNAELIDMSRRFWVSTILALPVFILAMLTDMAPGLLPASVSLQSVQWIEFALATPVVLWGGWPFFVRGWQSVMSWNLNMFTLIALGVSVAWSYSVVALLAPGIFPPIMQHADGTAAGSGTGTARPQPDQYGHQTVTGTFPKKRAHRPRRQHRGRHPAGTGTGRRSAACTPRRKNSGGRRGYRRQQRSG